MLVDEVIAVLGHAVASVNDLVEYVLRQSEIVLKAESDVKKFFNSTGVSILRGALLVKRARSSNELEFRDIDGKLINVEDEFQKNVLEPFFTLILTNNNQLKRFGCQICGEIIQVDPNWIPLISVPVLHCLQSKDVWVVLSVLKQSIRPFLKSFVLRQCLGSEHQLQMQTIELLKGWMDELIILLRGLDSESPTKRPRIAELRAGTKEVQLGAYRSALAALSDIIKMLCRETSVVENDEPLVDLIFCGATTLADLMLTPTSSKCGIPFVLALEQATNLLSNAEVKEFLLPSLLPVLAILVKGQCKNHALNSTEVPSNIGELATVSSPIETVWKSKQNDDNISLIEVLCQSDAQNRLAPPLLCCGKKRNYFRRILFKQLLYLIHTSRQDYPFSSLLLECILRLYPSRSHKFSLIGLQTLGQKLWDQNVLQKSSVTSQFEFETFVDSEFDVGSIPQSESLNFTSDGRAVKFENPEELDAVSWLAATKNQAEIVELLMRNFSNARLPQSLFDADCMHWGKEGRDIKSLISSQKGSTNVFSSQLDEADGSEGVIDNSKTSVETNTSLELMEYLKVLRIVSSPRVHSGSKTALPDDQQNAHEIAARIMNSFENLRKKIEETQTQSEHESDTFDLSDSVLCMPLQTDLDKSSDRETKRSEIDLQPLEISIEPTSIETIKKFKPSIQTLFLTHILTSDLPSFKSQGFQKTDSSDQIILFPQAEKALFDQVKSQVVQKLLFSSNGISADVEKRCVEILLKNIWEIDESEPNKLPSLWDWQIKKTLDLLYSKYSMSLQHAKKLRTNNVRPTKSEDESDNNNISNQAMNNCEGQQDTNKPSQIIHYTRSFPSSHIPEDMANNNLVLLHGQSVGIEVLGFEDIIDLMRKDEKSENFIDSSSLEKEESLINQQPLQQTTTVPLPFSHQFPLFSYDSMFQLCVSFANTTTTLSFSSTDIPTPKESTLLKHKQFAKVLLEFFSESPIVPLSGFKQVWEWLKDDGQLISSSPVEKKLGLAILSSILRSNSKDSTAKRTAYSILLNLCFDIEPTIRQEALGFVNRKFLYNPLAMGSSQHTSIAVDRFALDNKAATSSWIESLTEFSLSSIIDEFSNEQKAVRHIHLFVEELSKQICSRQKSLIKKISGLSTKERLEMRIKSCGLLFGVCCSHRPQFLGIMFPLFERIVSTPATEELEIIRHCLHNLFVDTLQWISPDKHRFLLNLLDDCQPSCYPLIEALLERCMMQCIQTQNSSNLMDIVKKGKETIMRLNAVELMVFLLPGLTEDEIAMVFPQLLDIGNKQITQKAIRSFLTIPNLSKSGAHYVPKAVWSGDRVLSYLFELGQPPLKTATTPLAPTYHHNNTPGTVKFKQVVEAVDICFEIAQMEPAIFPVDAFASFLSRLVDVYSPAAETPKRFPRLFGRFVLLIAVNLPAMSDFLINDVLQTILNHSRCLENSPNSIPIWEDALTWRGICATISRLWTSVDSTRKDDLCQIICSSTSDCFDLIFQNLQRAVPKAKADLTDYVLENVPKGSRPTPQAHVLNVLGL